MPLRGRTVSVAATSQHAAECTRRVGKSTRGDWQKCKAHSRCCGRNYSAGPKRSLRECQDSSKKLTALGQNFHVMKEEALYILNHLKPTETSLASWRGSCVWEPQSSLRQHPTCLTDQGRQVYLPKQWKKAIITPVPSRQTSPAKCLSADTITAVLIRAFERHVVRTHIYPALQIHQEASNSATSSPSDLQVRPSLHLSLYNTQSMLTTKLHTSVSSHWIFPRRSTRFAMLCGEDG